jgi:hypothetical protein
MKSMYKVLAIFFLIGFAFLNLQAQYNDLQLADVPSIFTIPEFDPPSTTMSVSWSSWNFGNLAAGNISSKTIIVKNTGFVYNLSITPSTDGMSPFSFTPAGTYILTPQQTKSFIVRFLTDCATSFGQTDHKTWFILNNSSNYGPSKSIALSGTSTCSGLNISVNPTTSLDFNTVNTGTGTKIIVVSNLCGSCGPITITTGNILPPFSVNPTGTFTINAGDSRTFTVTFAPLSVGTWSKTWHIFNTSPTSTYPMIFKGKRTL